jgi:hypothetical protein
VIVLRDASGATVRTMDVSDLDNTDNTAPLAVTVEARCDLGEWHQAQRMDLIPWGTRVSTPS